MRFQVLTAASMRMAVTQHCATAQKIAIFIFYAWSLFITCAFIFIPSFGGFLHTFDRHCVVFGFLFPSFCHHYYYFVVMDHKSDSDSYDVK
jgi:hypothetical protein